MSAVRLALLTGSATAGSFALFYLALHSPLVLALLGAALFGTAFMMVGASLGDDPLAADEAWRLEAGDLAGEEDSATAPAGRRGPRSPRATSAADPDGPVVGPEPDHTA